jgi:hypothetical protein
MGMTNLDKNSSLNVDLDILSKIKIRPLGVSMGPRDWPRASRLPYS